MPQRQRARQVSYDGLYWFFTHSFEFESIPVTKESSSIEWGPENFPGRWKTCVHTGCGMYIFRPPLYRECVYQRAPLNSVKFGTTGGDGIHYSFLVLDGCWSELSPVIVTDPTCCAFPEHNRVVAENLTEFLRLGIRTGYFALPAHVTDLMSHRDPSSAASMESQEYADWLEPEEVTALKRLAKKFKLDPLQGVARRLVELQRRYQPLMQQPPDPRPEWSEMQQRTLRQFQPGDNVIWEKHTSRADPILVKARVVAVTAQRVTIAAEDPDESGAGTVMRSVSPMRLRHAYRVDEERPPSPALVSRPPRGGS
jgi:hypothetical protein